MYFQKAGNYTGDDVRRLRKKRGMTQTDLAAYLNVSLKTVESWEAMTRNPSGPVCRLLDLLAKNKAVPFSRDRHYLHHHAFRVDGHPNGAMWIDTKGTLSVEFVLDGVKQRIPFAQDLPNDSSLLGIHDHVGQLVVKEYIRKKDEEKQLRSYADRLKKGG